VATEPAPLISAVATGRSAEREDQPAPGRASVFGRYLAIILAVGAVVRVVVYLRGYNFYIDEAALASSILSRSWRGLLMPPLDYGQLAPPGFLLLEAALSRMFGTSELALRALPFAASLLTLPLLVALGRQVLDRRAVLLVAAMAAVSYGLIFYGTQVKQYATDTLISTGLLLWALSLDRREWPYRGSLAYGAVGALLVWVSQPAIFVLAGVTVAAAWLLPQGQKWPGPRRLGVMASLWVPSAAAAAWAGLRYVQQPTYTNDFWHTGYFPWPVSNLFDLVWPVRALLRPLADPIGLVPGFLKWSSPQAILVVEFTFLAGPPIVLSFLAGILRAWKSGERAWLYIFAPAVVTFMVAVLHLYPFGSSLPSGGRTVLFLAPTYLLIVAYGAMPLWDRFAKWRRPAAVAVGLAPLTMLAVWLPTRHREELQPVLREMVQRWQPGDQLYVYYGALPAFRYYAPTTGTDTLPRVEGICAPLDPPAYTRQFDTVRPNPGLWVVFSHVNRSHGWAEDDYILAHLNRIGHQTASIEEEGASAHRFTLSPVDVPPRGGPVPYSLPNPLPHPIHRYDCGGGFGPQHLAQ
jgi:hypothetical protein